MSRVNKVSPAGSPADKTNRKRHNAFWALLLLLAAAFLAGAGIWGAGEILFRSNPRLNLREIRVEGSGYWKDHQEQLKERIALKTGKSLFAIDLKKTREAVRRIPNVDTCSIRPILPDMLVIEIVERVPRAYLNQANSFFVADGSTVIMPRNETIRYSRLPVITGIDLSDVNEGKPCEKIRPAMELIMTVVRNYPDIKIFRISLRDPKKLDILLRYRKFPISRVTIPVKNRGISFMILAFQSAVINARRMGETRNNYDLSFDGKCVIH